MEYQELQAKAKELGIKYIGVSRKELEKAIKETKSEVKEEITPPKKPKDNEKASVAVVKNAGGYEVRRYTLDIHGKNFKKLARQFADPRELEVELIEVKPGIKCPSCGHMIYPEA